MVENIIKDLGCVYISENILHATNRKGRHTGILKSTKVRRDGVGGVKFY